MLFVNKNLLKAKNGYILLDKTYIILFLLEYNYEKKNILTEEIF